MKSKPRFALVGTLLGLALALSPAALSQRRFPQNQPARKVTVTGIPGVVAAGAKWTLVWGQPDLADGIVGYKGGILYAQEESSSVARLDSKGRYSIFLKGAHGPGALGIDSTGRLLAVERTCTDPAQHPQGCNEPTALAELYPEYKVLTNNDGKGFGRVHDIVVDGKGGAFFNGPTGVFHFSHAGVLTTASSNPRSNGIALSPDGKTLYFTNGAILIACDVQPDYTCSHERTFAKIEAGGRGDGMAIDGDGRVYVSTAPGIQVFSAEGKYLGVIPTPRPITSVTFSGPDKKTLYVTGRGATEPDGREYETRPGVSNYARTVYKIKMIARGYMGRVK